MDGSRYDPAAAWPRVPKITSTLATVLLLGAAIVAYRAVPRASGFTHDFGIAIALLLPALLLWAMSTAIAGYDVSPTHLVVQQWLGRTRIPLVGLRPVYADPRASRNAMRLFDNGGLFGFTGLYRNQAPGNFRLYATELEKSVVLVLADRTVVITPADARAFVAQMQRLFPLSRLAHRKARLRTASHCGRIRLD